MFTLYKTDLLPIQNPSISHLIITLRLKCMKCIKIRCGMITPQDTDWR